MQQPLVENLVIFEDEERWIEDNIQVDARHIRI